MIWDSRSIITLAKYGNFLEYIKRCKVTMCSDGSNRNIEEQCRCPGVVQAYLDGQAIMTIISQIEAIKRGYHVFFNLRKENTFIIEDHRGRVARDSVD